VVRAADLDSTFLLKGNGEAGEFLGGFRNRGLGAVTVTVAVIVVAAIVVIVVVHDSLINSLLVQIIHFASPMRAAIPLPAAGTKPVVVVVVNFLARRRRRVCRWIGGFRRRSCGPGIGG